MKLILPAALLFLSLNAQAETEVETRKGKPIARIFTNFHAGFGESKKDLGFELSRSYLGYEYNLSHNLIIKGILDVGQSKQVDDYQRIAYIKNMMIQWKHKQLSLQAGLIPTIQFGFQEKFWGLRFVHKSFQDENKFGESADLGISVSYAFNERLTADAIIANGEGYKKVQLNKGLLYGAGITFTPFSGLFMRLYGGTNQAIGEEKKETYNLSTFLGYKHSSFSIGAEYNFMKERHTEDISSPQGFSIYSSTNITKRFCLFGRYDQLFSSANHNSSKDEKKFIFGSQISLTKNIKLAPTFIYTQMKNNDKPGYLAGIYCYFGI